MASGACVIPLNFRSTDEDVKMSAFFKENLPRCKRRRQVVFAEVPRNATGKLEKPKLREAHAKGKSGA